MCGVFLPPLPFINPGLRSRAAYTAEFGSQFDQTAKKTNECRRSATLPRSTSVCIRGCPPPGRCHRGRPCRSGSCSAARARICAGMTCWPLRCCYEYHRRSRWRNLVWRKSGKRRLHNSYMEGLYSFKNSCTIKVSMAERHQALNCYFKCNCEI